MNVHIKFKDCTIYINWNQRNSLDSDFCFMAHFCVHDRVTFGQNGQTYFIHNFANRQLLTPHLKINNFSIEKRGNILSSLPKNTISSSEIHGYFSLSLSPARQHWSLTVSYCVVLYSAHWKPFHLQLVRFYEFFFISFFTNNHCGRERNKIRTHTSKSKKILN